MEHELTSRELEELEEAVQRALDAGAAGALEVLGYGEISTVVRWSASGRAVAVKRLPPFADPQSFEAYRDCVADYLGRLEGAGVTPLSTTVQGLERADGSWSAYCVQPMVPGKTIVPQMLRDGSRDDGLELLIRIVERITAAVSGELGLDAQASNWIVRAGQLSYLDVSTPLMRDAQGGERLDTELFLASLPWALRGAIRWRFLGAILDKYYEPRGAVVDMLGNLHKEGLGRLIPPAIERLEDNPLLQPPISVSEVKRYYRSDAGMWALLQRLRRADRFWQRRVRRREYPFLLPGQIERNV